MNCLGHAGWDDLATRAPSCSALVHGVRGRRGAIREIRAIAVQPVCPRLRRSARTPHLPSPPGTRHSQWRSVPDVWQSTPC